MRRQRAVEILPHIHRYLQSGNSKNLRIDSNLKRYSPLLFLIIILLNSLKQCVYPDMIIFVSLITYLEQKEAVLFSPKFKLIASHFSYVRASIVFLECARRWVICINCLEKRKEIFVKHADIYFFLYCPINKYDRTRLIADKATQTITDILSCLRFCRIFFGAYFSFFI